MQISRNALRSVRREWPSGADDGRPKGVNEMTREERAEKKRIVQSLGEAFRLCRKQSESS